MPIRTSSPKAHHAHADDLAVAVHAHAARWHAPQRGETRLYDGCIFGFNSCSKLLELVEREDINATDVVGVTLKILRENCE